MVAIKYVGPGRYGAAGRIWAPGEIMEMSPDVAKELLKDPHFEKAEKPVSAGEPAVTMGEAVPPERPKKHRRKAA